MLQIERFRIIENLVSERGHISIAELEDVLKTSKATIYRDLRQISKQGNLQIIRGGVSNITQGKIYEQAYHEKRSSNSEEKKRIAKAALEYIQPNHILFLDSSTTVFEMTRDLLSKKTIQVITNDVKISSELSNASGLNVFVTGGLLRAGYYTLTGVLAQNSLNGLRIDISFMGCDAINTTNGCMITNIEEISIKKMATGITSKTIILCDHSKFGHFAFASFCELSQIDIIITGNELDNAIFNEFVEAGINIRRV